MGLLSSTVLFIKLINKHNPFSYEGENTYLLNQ